MNAPPDLVLFFGRFHPLLVHLPIGLLVIIGFLELVSKSSRFKNANSNVGLLLALAAPLSIATAVAGYLLSLGGGYDSNLIDLHMWTGIGTAAICVVAALLFWCNWKKTYRVALFIGICCLAVSSHFGGSLTHGSDYLTRYAPPFLKGKLPVQASKQGTQSKLASAMVMQEPLFASVVQPILQDKCVACHGPEKSKGGLRMDTFEALLKGGDSGSTVMSGKSADSEIIKRLLLPIDEDDHMPPDGKPQPSREEIAILRWWIDAGASREATVEALQPPPAILEILQKKFGVAPTTQTKSTRNTEVSPKPREEVSTLLDKLSATLDIPISFVSQSDAWVQCNAGVRASGFGDKELALLDPLRPNMRWLDLAGTSVTDEGLKVVGRMSNLDRLHLQRTRVSSAGLKHLSELASLRYLNLYGTAVTDDGLDYLKSLPALRQLYLWQSQVTTGAAKAFAEARIENTQIAAWEEEIEQLKAKIRDHQIIVQVGSAAPKAIAAMAVTPVNKECPVSGKAVDLSKTVSHEGKVVAFCCDDCKAQFEKDPKRFLEKLGLGEKKKEKSQSR